MSTGSLAVVLGNTPNRFTGLETIGKVVFIFNLVLFTIFNICMFARFLLVPRKLLGSLHHPVEGLFFGTYWVSVALILNCIYIYGNTSTGTWLTKTLEILYWMYCAAAFLVGVIQYSLFFRLERLNVGDAVPAWIFPIYPLLVVGTLAGTILPSQPETPSWKIFVGAIHFQGLAWVVSFLLYALYMQRLMTSSLPSPTTRPGMYVSVGPAGKSILCIFSYHRGIDNDRLHRRWSHLPREPSTVAYRRKLLYEHCSPRRGDCTHHRHYGRPFHHIVRILVLHHNNHRCHSGNA